MAFLRTIIIVFVLTPLLTTKSYAIEDNLQILINDVISGSHRAKTNKARDVYRHPKQTLLFFGIKKNMTVLEILPGRGWYTEILSPILKDEGKLTVAGFGENHPKDYLRKSHIKFVEHLGKNPKLYEKIKHEVFNDKNYYLKGIAPNSHDMILTFRNTHNWIKNGGVENVYRAFHRVLKKGGVLGVVQHRAHNNDNPNESANDGYVPESYLINLAERIGFELVEKSEINANLKDNKNHPKGVWTLPPTLRLGDADMEKYIKIGESDRMTLRFIKK
jgi:predicted methyltransferase